MLSFGVCVVICCRGSGLFYIADSMACNRTRFKPGRSEQAYDKSAVRGGKCKYTAVLNMLCQKVGAAVQYNLISTSGPPHKPTFIYRAVINGKPFPEGRGGSKKEAQGDAARLALDYPALMSCIQKQSGVSSDKWENHHSSAQQDKNSDEAESVACYSSQSSLSSYCVDMLQDFAQKRKLKIKFSIHREPRSGRYSGRWSIGNRLFEKVTGSIKNRIKTTAARIAYCILINEFIEKVRIGSSTETACVSNSRFFQKNFENLLYKYAKKTGLKADCIHSIKPASDEREYVCKWKLGDREFDDALGCSRREARNSAARVAFCTIVNEYTEEGNFWENFSRTSSGSSGASDSRKRTYEQDRSADRLPEEKRSRRDALGASTDHSNSQHMSQKMMIEKQEEIKVLSEFRESQCACLRLDKQQGKLKPKESWFWPKLLISDDEDDSDDEYSGGTLKAEGMDRKSLSDAEKLMILTSYLRENYFYCIWCRTEYNDRKDLLSECPGPCREAHQ